MQAGAPNLLVFREDRRRLRGQNLKLSLMRDLDRLGGHHSVEKLVGTLLRAGELECAVTDAGTVPAQPFMKVTERLAEALVACDSTLSGAAAPGCLEPLNSNESNRILAQADLPEQVEISPAEGFAYYALHPLKYAEALDRIPALPPSALVVGVRSIGTTLSAIVSAALRSRGTTAERITVRPIGHPYNRKTCFSPAQQASVRRHLARDAVFVIVDEGPGLSGSSFLSAAEALLGAGAERRNVILICGREPDFDSLCADNGPDRARRFQWAAVSSQPRKPAGAEIFVGGGEWRRWKFIESGLWPASWISFERLKYLSNGDERTRLFKFAGLAHYGERVLEREGKVALAGFGPSPQRETEGFASYGWIPGRPLTADDLSGEVIARLASYCAFRADAFADQCSDLTALESMARHNLDEFGMEKPVSLRLERPVLADGRMQPHEWLRGQNGEILKTDSGSHGDDHFFPGVTDIAWDLAGAIVEWRMDAAASKALLECYRRASGDDAGRRVPDFITAYATFRCAYCIMSAHALRGSEEQARLEQAAGEYRAVLDGQFR